MMEKTVTLSCGCSTEGAVCSTAEALRAEMNQAYDAYDRSKKGPIQEQESLWSAYLEARTRFDQHFVTMYATHE